MFSLCVYGEFQLFYEVLSMVRYLSPCDHGLPRLLILHRSVAVLYLIVSQYAQPPGSWNLSASSTGSPPSSRATTWWSATQRQAGRRAPFGGTELFASELPHSGASGDGSTGSPPGNFLRITAPYCWTSVFIHPPLSGETDILRFSTPSGTTAASRTNSQLLKHKVNTPTRSEEAC